ncbi:DUF2306 domain-containing protein [Deinococcus saxicola]|uniref:hypothetical protein n=1 Tax=Deinococcus saxicola TaxID=249406 RepID=UPI0039F00D41
MTDALHTALRSIHIILGMAGFLLGAWAIFAPKFGQGSRWHRYVGRGYAVSMLGMGLLSVPLAWRQGDILLLMIGLVTLGWVAAGWLFLRQFLQARAAGRPDRAASRLRLHINMMGSSYIAAWTAFLVNVQPLGTGGLWMTLYIAVPSVVGSLAIARAMIRQSAPGPSSAGKGVGV